MSEYSPPARLPFGEASAPGAAIGMVEEWRAIGLVEELLEWRAIGLVKEWLEWRAIGMCNSQKSAQLASLSSTCAGLEMEHTRHGG